MAVATSDRKMLGEQPRIHETSRVLDSHLGPYTEPWPAHHHRRVDGALLMPGVTVGTGAVIGAGAVVTRDIEPYTIAVGVSARSLRRRFPEDVAEALLRIAWWDWPRELLAERLDDLIDLDSFLKKYA